MTLASESAALSSPPSGSRSRVGIRAVPGPKLRDIHLSTSGKVALPKNSSARAYLARKAV